MSLQKLQKWNFFPLRSILTLNDKSRPSLICLVFVTDFLFEVASVQMKWLFVSLQFLGSCLVALSLSLPLTHSLAQTHTRTHRHTQRKREKLAYWKDEGVNRAERCLFSVSGAIGCSVVPGSRLLHFPAVSLTLPVSPSLLFRPQSPTLLRR